MHDRQYQPITREYFVSFCTPITLNDKLRINETENSRKLCQSQSKFYSIYKKKLFRCYMPQFATNSRTQHRGIRFRLQNSLFRRTVAAVARPISAGLEIKLQTIGSRRKHRNHLTGC